jgi:hypothetical protein
MNSTMNKLLIFVGGAAVGALATSAFTSQRGVRPALANVAAGAMDVRDKALGALERTREDVGDFMAEVEHARQTRQQVPHEDPQAKKG